LESSNASVRIQKRLLIRTHRGMWISRPTPTA